MNEHLLISLGSILVLGVGAQWLAWRLRLPSILLLLLFGFIAGPIAGLVDPDELFGRLLFPLVSVSVAIILFEGGLSLRLSEIPKVRGVIFRLITIGTIVTWAIIALAAYYILAMDLALSILLGAILVVTGPTVVGPLLQQIRPRGQAGVVLKWEGILIDPVGVMLAVLIFEAILSDDLYHAPLVVLNGVLLTLLIGVVLGVLSASLMVALLRRHWIPDHLQNGFSLLLAVSAFVASDLLHPESGLLTVTVMGIFLANQKWVSIKHLIEFKESLRVLFIGSLFILLAARLKFEDITGFGWEGPLFMAVLVLLARPLATLVSTWRSELSGRERLFIAWMAPRGIVAASVASIFAFDLVAAGHVRAEQLKPVTFLVIV
ncbi:MAG TPA: sodium:proton antiporter, partial [Anaerolineae bacterium]|nr:sodium:proton antiporter [Anaerolineae bacterium]